MAAGGMLCLKALDVCTQILGNDVNSIEFLVFRSIFALISFDFLWLLHVASFFPDTFSLSRNGTLWHLIIFSPVKVTHTPPGAASLGQQPQLSAGSGSASTSGRTSGGLRNHVAKSDIWPWVKIGAPANPWFIMVFPTEMVFIGGTLF